MKKPIAVVEEKKGIPRDVNRKMGHKGMPRDANTRRGNKV